MPGVTACMESLARSLCNPGDVVLSPSPIYHRIKTNFEDAGARIVHMVTTQDVSLLDHHFEIALPIVFFFFFFLFFI